MRVFTTVGWQPAMSLNLFNEVALLLTLAFAAVATSLLLFRGAKGKRQRKRLADSQERQRSQTVIRELESISQRVRRSLDAHQASVVQFKSRLGALGTERDVAGSTALSDEALRMLRPTMRLSTEIARAYDEIRHQANVLMSLTDVRTDPLTGLRSRRAMDDVLKTLFAMNARYNTDFALAIVDIDHFKRLNDEHGHLFGDQILQQFAEILDRSARATDCAARFAGEEFVVIMPHTELEGACEFAERLRSSVEESLPVTISIGVTVALADDSTETLLGRADRVLSSAKSAGRNCVFRHNGRQMEAVDVSPLTRFDAEDLEKDVPRIDQAAEETIVETEA